MYLYRVDLLLVLPVMENQPFTCGICPKQFSSRPNMLLHQRTHTPATHKCPQCQAKFSRSDLLQNHVKTHGKKRRFEHDPMVDQPILHVLDGSDVCMACYGSDPRQLLQNIGTLVGCHVENHRRAAGTSHGPKHVPIHRKRHSR